MVDKKARIQAFKNLEGWFKKTGTSDSANPENSTKRVDSYFLLNLQHLHSRGQYALYKAITFKSQEVTDNLASTGATTSATKIKGVVATFNDNGKMILEVIAYDDKNTMNLQGNGKRFEGTLQEFGMNTDLKNDSDLFGGVVGGVTLRKLAKAPAAYRDLDFKAAYAAQFVIFYPNGDK